MLGAVSNFLVSHQRPVAKQPEVAFGCAVEWNRHCQKNFCRTYARCLHGDIASLLSPCGNHLLQEAQCVTHNRKCEVQLRPVDNFISLDIAGVFFLLPNLFLKSLLLPRPIFEGAPCVCWSMMGSRTEEEHAAYVSHVQWQKQRRLAATAMIIFENVPEFNMSILDESFPRDRYQIHSVKIDPRLFGLPVARPRLYALILDSHQVRWEFAGTLGDFVQNLTCQIAMPMECFFWQSLPPVDLSAAKAKNLEFYEADERSGLLVDLSQYKQNNRGRSELKDGSLMTLTTNSGNIFHRDSCSKKHGNRRGKKFIVACYFYSKTHFMCLLWKIRSSVFLFQCLTFLM